MRKQTLIIAGNVRAKAQRDKKLRSAKLYWDDRDKKSE